MPYTTVINTHLVGLKKELQELESVVQEPHDDKIACIAILAIFPPVIQRFKETLSNILQQMQQPAVSDCKLFHVAAENGWLRGDISVWNKLDFYCQVLADIDSLESSEKERIIKEVRSNSYMLWQTFEVLNLKFRNGHIRPSGVRMPSSAAMSSF